MFLRKFVYIYVFLAYLKICFLLALMKTKTCKWVLLNQAKQHFFLSENNGWMAY